MPISGSRINVAIIPCTKLSMHSRWRNSVQKWRIAPVYRRDASVRKTIDWFSLEDALSWMIRRGSIHIGIVSDESEYSQWRTSHSVALGRQSRWSPHVPVVNQMWCKSERIRSNICSKFPRVVNMRLGINEISSPLRNRISFLLIDACLRATFSLRTIWHVSVVKTPVQTISSTIMVVNEEIYSLEFSFVEFRNAIVNTNVVQCLFTLLRERIGINHRRTNIPKRFSSRQSRPLTSSWLKRKSCWRANRFKIVRRARNRLARAICSVMHPTTTRITSPDDVERFSKPSLEWHAWNRAINQSMKHFLSSAQSNCSSLQADSFGQNHYSTIEFHCYIGETLRTA